MRIALAQINSNLGAFADNAEKIIEFIHRAHERRCDLVVFPEAALFGYHPVDLLERQEVVASQLKELKKIEAQVPDGMAAVVGLMAHNLRKKGKPFLNAAAFIQKGKKTRIYGKELLPTYDVFDEGRHIEPGCLENNIVTYKGKKILITICEDIWGWPDSLSGSLASYPYNPLQAIKGQSIDLVLNLSASPYTDQKLAQRQHVVAKTAKYLGAPVVYTNMIGAQDELIYDGASFVVNRTGQVLCSAARFEEDLLVVDLRQKQSGYRPQTSSLIENQRRAITLGIRDFVAKTGFKKVHLGLSGGIDSALVACLAVDAIGPQNVLLVGLPGPFTSSNSQMWSKKLSESLGSEYIELSIQNTFDACTAEIDNAFGKQSFSLVHENIQARARGSLLMAISNLKGSLLLNTSNKSELAMGYSTLYGDQVGGLCPIGDLLKTEVFALAKHYNAQSEVIPWEIINRPPSAELRPNQRDEDSLPPYKELDKAVEKLVEGFRPSRGALEKQVLNSLYKSEFKRWQAPPILKVSAHAFGRGRRLPIAHSVRA